MWHVYILECADKTYYTGIAKDLKKRIDEHNDSSKGAKYTRARRPVHLIYSCGFGTQSEALKEECRIKKLSKEEKTKMVFLRLVTDAL